MNATAQPGLRGPDRWFLRNLKLVVRKWFDFMLFLRRRHQFTRYHLLGDCNQCAVCCERPSVMVDDITFKVKPIRWMFLWWQRVVNGMDLVSADEPGTFLFRCNYFDTQKRACTSYPTRPGMCRDYPRLLIYQPEPEFYQECSYKVVARNSKSLLRILDRAELPPERREEMKRKLRIE